jgi:prophage DNA circulation protein
MFGWLFGRKKDDKPVEDGVKKSFNSVKDDINSLGKWVEHLNNKDSSLENEISDLNEKVASIKKDVEGIKNVVDTLDRELFKQLFKTERVKTVKQTPVQAVQLGVQTGVQTGVYGIFNNFSTMERAIVWVLLNTDLKLSYDDLAAMMGKSRATIRGQINSIKQKNENLIQEIVEKNGKKRLFIEEEIKEKILKNVKIKEKSSKNS